MRSFKGKSVLKVPTWLEVDLDALLGNVRAIRGVLGKGVEILLTIKADAYGHGSVQVAQAVETEVQSFGVATVDEARELQRAGFGDRILILSPILSDEIPVVVDNGFALTVSSLAFADRVSQYAVKTGNAAQIHVEVDTGMGRTGFSARDAETLIAQMSSFGGIRLAGLFTHFPCADTDPDLTRSQLAAFLAFADRLRERGVRVPKLHSANSAALAGLEEARLDMVRPGLLAYGRMPNVERGGVAARPVMCWKTRLVQLRDVPAGTAISYGGEHVTSRPTLLGVIPVGYGHGYPYRLSGCGQVLVSGKRVPILGRVTMDMTMVDLTDVEPRPRAEDEVVLIGSQADAEITVDEVAAWAGTIPYEILCGVSKRVPRFYIRNRKMEMVKSLLGVMPNTVS